MKRWFRKMVDGGPDHTDAVAHRIRSLKSATDLVAADDPEDIRRRLKGGRSQLAGIVTDAGGRIS